MPTGTIGTPSFDRQVGGAVEQRLHDRAPLAGALGEQHQRLAGAQDHLQRRRASRSAVPRATGSPPSAESTQAKSRFAFHRLSLPR